MRTTAAGVSRIVIGPLQNFATAISLQGDGNNNINNEAVHPQLADLYKEVKNGEASQLIWPL